MRFLRLAILLAGGALVSLLLAIAIYRLAGPGTTPASYRETIARATRYLDEDKPALALQSVRPILDKDNDAGEALAVAGFALAALDGCAEARVYLENALKREPMQPRAHKILAAIYLDSAGRALAHDPVNFDAHVARATSRLLAGEPKNALDDLETAVAVNPNSVEASRLLAQVESRLGLTDRAEKSTSRARSIKQHYVCFDRLTNEIVQRPDDPEPRWRMGQAAAEANMLEIAANCFRAALAIDPHCQPAREGLRGYRRPFSPSGNGAITQVPHSLSHHRYPGAFNGENGQ